MPPETLDTSLKTPNHSPNMVPVVAAGSGSVQASGSTNRVIPATSIFESEFQKLNDAQRSAVETIEGPVMVIAGPGTGKTQVVAMRVANILKKTQMRPSNILCLTFSTSGATAMRDRLRLLIGPDAYGVTVSTIHGFCADLISTHPELFEEWSAKDQITDVERYRSLNTIIDQLLPDLAIVNPKSPYNRTKDILDRISQVKREGKTHKDICAVADEYESIMSSKSKEGTKAHEKNLLAVRKYREFCEIFSGYQAMLTETQRYDYDDMILYAIRALEREEWLLMGLQERFQYLLVDEFQDTNGAQYRLIELLTTYPHSDNAPNLFAVGDDDQAVYRFQGANLQNMLSFHTRFPSAPVIVLQTSYRSTQSILDAAGKVIDHNTERLVGRIEGLQKKLAAASGESGDPPRLLRPASDMAEPWMLADLIEKELAEGVAPREIAVLTQTNGELRNYYDVFTARGIPVQMTGKVDLLSHPLVQQLIAVLQAIRHPDRDGYLAPALAIDGFACHPADLARLYQLSRDQKCSLKEVLLQLDTPDSPAKNVPFQDVKNLLWARDTLLALIEKRPLRAVIETVERVIHDCQFLHREEKQIDVLDLAAVQEFFDRVKRRVYETPDYGFETFLNDLEFYMNPEYRALRMTYELPHLVSEGVRLMTAHQSKGLEFHSVYLVNFRDGHWDKRRNPSSLSLPEDLLFGWEKEQKEFEKHQDERRVAFVAMTRAKKNLIFSCPVEMTSGEKARAVSPSAYFAEAGILPEVHVPLKDPEKASTLLLRPIRAIDAEMRAYLEDRLKTFALSASGLNRFLRDPQEFLEIDLLRIPILSPYEFAYGNAVHWALRQWGLGIQQGVPLGKSDVISAFKKYLTDREFVTDGERDRLFHVGEETLTRYYDQKLQSASPVIHAVEVSLTTHLGDIPLKGAIDRIDLSHPDSSSATIIDYKTGAPQTESQIKSGDYYRQLVFYALLLEGGRSWLEPKAFILDFVGERSEHPIERVFQIAEEERVAMRQLVRNVWKKITTLDFTAL
jgi:DNA helicase-2/ATP-dependent DNA helicase PcrA